MRTADNKSIEALSVLIDATTPRELNKTIQTLLFAYVHQQSEFGSDDDFRKHIDNCQLLIRFFEELPE